MRARNRFRLRAEPEHLVMVAAVREERDYQLHAMLVRYVEKLVDTFLESHFVGIPQPLVQVDAQGIEPDALRQ